MKFCEYPPNKKYIPDIENEVCICVSGGGFPLQYFHKVC